MFSQLYDQVTQLNRSMYLHRKTISYHTCFDKAYTKALAVCSSYGVLLPFAEVDYCFLELDNCHSNAQCINTVEGFSCRCTPGFTGNGVSCNG